MKQKKPSKRFQMATNCTNGHFNEKFCVNKSDCNHSLVDLVDGIKLMPQLTKIARKTLAMHMLNGARECGTKNSDDYIKKAKKATLCNWIGRAFQIKWKKSQNEGDSIGNIVGGTWWLLTLCQSMWHCTLCAFIHVHLCSLLLNFICNISI